MHTRIRHARFRRAGLGSVIGLLLALLGSGTPATVDLEFHEGTDMEVVPSPDGRRLALQLWQHIWVLNAAGGEARRITNAIEPPDEHWFPRWSPDGRTIVFSSLRRDAGLLAVSASGGEPRHLTDGRYDWWPSWSPDGSTIVFWRPLAGALWTIPADGGVPQRLTPDTLRATNPAWSPDGRWIAFSSQGRLHLISPDGATIRRLTAGPGDQAPSWSPSGEDVFFLSDRSGRLQIWSVSTEGGDPRRLTDDEDVHAYPPHWLRDRNVLVYAAAGTIRTLDPTSGVRDSIPFRARLSLPPATYSRRTPRIAAQGARSRVRGISRLAPSPDGSRLVFVALGDLWMRDTDGRVAQMTSGADDDKDPAWSPDGRRIAFVSNAAGDYCVFMLDIDSRVRRRVTNTPGHAAAPVWNPTGDSIAYVQWPAPNRGRLSLNVVSIEGGPGRVLVQPQAMDVRPLIWTAERGVIYAELLSRPGGQGIVTRVRHSSGSQPEPLLGEWPPVQLDFVAISPDARQVAFVDRSELRVRSLETNSPERIVRGPAAFFPAWAGNRQVMYLSGGEARRVDVLRGQDRALPIDLSYTVPRHPGTLLLRNARLLTPEPRAGLWDMLIEHGLIRSVRRAGAGPPKADSVVDLAGRTVIPGLIDAHVHVFRGVFAADALLYWGVTAVGDAGAEGHEAIELAETIESGRLAGPRMFTAGGFVVSGRMNAFPQFLRVDSQTQLERQLDHIAGLGATQVKAYQRSDPWLQAATVRAAHARGLPVLSHSLGPAGVAAGLDRKEHAFYESVMGDVSLRFRQDVIEILRRARITLTPTLVFAFSQAVDGRARTKASLSDSAVSGFMRPSMSENLRRQLDQPSPAAAGWAQTLTVMQANVAAARAAGVTLAAGTDRSDNVLALHWELELLVDAGLSPLEALRAATVGAAQALGVDGRLGVIAEGALADLVVLDADPLSDIRNTRRIWAVVKDGRIVDRRQVLADARERNAAH